MEPKVALNQSDVRYDLRSKYHIELFDTARMQYIIMKWLM